MWADKKRRELVGQRHREKCQKEWKDIPHITEAPINGGLFFNLAFEQKLSHIDKLRIRKAMAIKRLLNPVSEKEVIDDAASKLVKLRG